MASQGEYRTRQRERILQLLTERRGEHLSAEEVVDLLRREGAPVGRATVYRYLERLVEQGSARKYFLEGGAGCCYQYSGGEDCREHFHLKCTGCGALFHVDCDYLDALERHVFDHHQFIIDNTKTVLYGLCAGCAAKKGEPPCKD